ncbi:sulfite exporter TauE/SafE family protein [Amphritea sp. 1_MG-2023]|uniref:sulfite exporter TauE/SafE family protein n=1 Tax=Amphritea sp. 1_MG-2023 TaxID=3062670 RepID=UPI0026E15D01|nr:sulfite exporter TauE/SafE family protein [Amphritea sp. 1_MG-2023]MDO6563153.1 sulfite exporter TauE/SafE family protein [Amphritea sp. 1_MG-2023]
MADLQLYQYSLIGLLFVWSGFIRSGLGFGGSVLTLPFLLFIIDDPLIFLPIIGVHLMVFSLLITWQSRQRMQQTAMMDQAAVSSIDWRYLRYALLIMIVPKMIGIFGLLTLSSSLMSAIIYVIVIAYAISYVLNRPFKSNHRSLDILFLVLGGYVSGTSLIGAPLIAAVFASHVSRERLRDTLFVLWFILVVIKLSSFIVAGIDLQLIHHLWLLPCAYIGHLLGQQMHSKLMSADTRIFYRVLGTVLIVVSSLGLMKTLLI